MSIDNKTSVITLNNDTINGQALGTPSEDRLSFLNSEKHIEYHPFEIKGFIYKNEFYASVKINASDSSLFLSKMITGAMNLYKTCHCKYIKTDIGSSTKCITDLYLKKDDENYAFLAYSRNDSSNDTVTQINTDESFYKYFEDYPVVIQKLKNKTYNRSDIIKIVKDYNIGILYFMTKP
jgi:hypothetical protein